MTAADSSAPAALPPLDIEAPRNEDALRTNGDNVSSGSEPSGSAPAMAEAKLAAAAKGGPESGEDAAEPPIAEVVTYADIAKQFSILGWSAFGAWRLCCVVCVCVRAGGRWAGRGSSTSNRCLICVALHTGGPAAHIGLFEKVGDGASSARVCWRGIFPPVPPSRGMTHHASVQQRVK
jgi:hypothetical protein